MKYAVVTFGCRVNQADSLGFEEDLRAAGAESAPAESADLVIVNTCSVTATSDQGARQTIRRIARDNPSAKIVVTGCYATRSAEEVAALPNVAQVVCNDDKPRLLPLIARTVETAENSTAKNAENAERNVFSAFFAFSAVRHSAFSRDGDGPCGAAIEPGVAGRTAYTLRVQTGCAEPCSYCIIPSTRGRPRSVPIADLLREIDRVVAAGFKEVALTGVHLGSYGRDLDPAVSLIDLLRALDSCGAGLQACDRGAEAPRHILFRISSLEPMDCTRDIVDLVATSGCFAPHFHLPLQHASNRVLAAMCRPYTIEYYSTLVDEIRSRMPNASIGSDVIVGFPGETDEDFEQLASYLERSPLTHVHVFPYSDRPGTAASKMGNKIHGAVIRERGGIVRAIGARLTERFRDSQIGTTHRALTLEDGALAVTGNYLKLRIPPGKRRNEWIQLRVTSQGDGELLRR